MVFEMKLFFYITLKKWNEVFIFVSFQFMVVSAIGGSRWTLFHTKYDQGRKVSAIAVFQYLQVFFEHLTVIW